MTVEKASEEFRCSHCESLGEIPFSCFQRQHQNVSVRVWVRNLPEGISESGVKNLFVAIGKPISISFSAKNKTALVEFEFLNEAELAVRDLHCKPPYKLRVSVATPKFHNSIDRPKTLDLSEPNDYWDFSQPENPKNEIQSETAEQNTKPNEVIKQLRNVIKNLHYDPSIRMRQKKLDFRTDVECISRGRGYINMGKAEKFVGGLQKCEFIAENSKAKHKMEFFCENCKALTTKICDHCSSSYCSKMCLSNSSINHSKGCANESKTAVNPIRTVCSDFNVSQSSEHSYTKCRTLVRCQRLVGRLKKRAFSQWILPVFRRVPLTSGCTVVISVYFTMQTVTVRRSDEPWEEKFTRLCNDIAAEAFKGDKLEVHPEAGDLVIARYYADHCYYRAQVLSGVQNKVNLVFVDFGNTQETDVEDLKPLPDDLKSVPALAVRVHLKDVSDDSSLASVNYYNTLTANRVPLILNFDEATSEVILIEKDSKTVVNQTVMEYMLPSWKKDDSAFSKLGEVLYLNSIERGRLEIGKTCDLILSHFDEKEFLESEVFWVTNPEADDFFHAKSQMYLRIRDYCEFLKDDCYLPRDNELCLAREGGEWHRCSNLKSHKTTCCVFFIDDGHSSLINTSDIRKMIADFAEAPSQAICCTLPDDPKLKTNKEIQSKAIKYLKESVGQTIESIGVLKLMGDAYCLSVPEIDKMLSGAEACS